MLPKIQMYIIIGVVLLASTLTIYYFWKKDIERQALLEYNQRQIEQNIKDQEDLKKKIEAIRTIQDEFIKRDLEEKKDLDDRINNIMRGIDSDSETDKPASIILRKTIDELRKLSK